MQKWVWVTGESNIVKFHAIRYKIETFSRYFPCLFFRGWKAKNTRPWPWLMYSLDIYLKYLNIDPSCLNIWSFRTASAPLFLGREAGSVGRHEVNKAWPESLLEKLNATLTRVTTPSRNERDGVVRWRHDEIPTPATPSLSDLHSVDVVVPVSI